MNFAGNLKNLRKSKNVTQKWLADYLKLSRSTIAGYESQNHHPDFENLEKISQFFQVSIHFLLTGSDYLETYNRLSPESKQDVLKYIKLLQSREK